MDPSDTEGEVDDTVDDGFHHIEPHIMSVAQLKQALKTRGCSFTGSKDTLVERLVQDRINQYYGPKTEPLPELPAAPFALFSKESKGQKDTMHAVAQAFSELSESERAKYVALAAAARAAYEGLAPVRWAAENLKDLDKAPFDTEPRRHFRILSAWAVLSAEDKRKFLRGPEAEVTPEPSGPADLAKLKRLRFAAFTKAKYDDFMTKRAKPPNLTDEEWKAHCAGDTLFERKKGMYMAFAGHGGETPASTKLGVVWDKMSEAEKDTFLPAAKTLESAIVKKKSSSKPKLVSTKKRDSSALTTLQELANTYNNRPDAAFLYVFANASGSTTVGTGRFERLARNPEFVTLISRQVQAKPGVKAPGTSSSLPEAVTGQGIEVSTFTSSRESMVRAVRDHTLTLMSGARPVVPATTEAGQPEKARHVRWEVPEGWVLQGWPGPFTDPKNMGVPQLRQVIAAFDAEQVSLVKLTESGALPTITAAITAALAKATPDEAIRLRAMQQIALNGQPGPVNAGNRKRKRLVDSVQKRLESATRLITSLANMEENGGKDDDNDSNLGEDDN